MSGQPYERFIHKVKEIRTLNSVLGLLSWDQETQMPPKAIQARAEQVETLSALVHGKLVSEEMGALLQEVSCPGSATLTAEAAANVREFRRYHERSRKMPEDLVRELSRTCALAHEAWVKARQSSAFDIYAPLLEKMVALKRREAEVLGYAGGHVYDPLLDQYEPMAKTAEIGPLLAGLRDRLVPLVRAIANSPRRPRQNLFPEGSKFPREAQREFGLAVVRDMGFDLEAGRLDTSHHPFCSSAAPTDVRLTTRYDEADPRSGFFSIIHEAGHGLYEQGFDPEHTGTPMSEAVSSGIHESQSRLWENQVARSRPFWERYYPKLREHFPAALERVTLDDFHFAVNEVRPSLIRVDSDELTYNLHILLRFEIECDLLTGALAVSDLPKAWNAKTESLLGLTPPNDADGVLQDIHWSFGGFGYFPTYTLGNLYAAQFMATAHQEIPDLEARIRMGDLRTLREWLREKIHRHGMRWHAHELVVQVTGKPLGVEPFFDYLREKFAPLYGI